MEVDSPRGSVTINETYTTPVYHHNAMEPHATIAEWTNDELTVYDSTQAVFGLSNLISTMLSVPKEKVRVVSLFIGGGFGSKGFSWPHTFMAVMAARLVNRPVKIVLSRQQMFTTAGRRSQTIQHLVTNAERTGKISNIKHETISETSFVDEFVEPAGLATSWLYNVPNVNISHSIVRLNKGTPCPTRAPGEAVGTFALEVMMDELSYELKMDPIELRLQNYAEEDLQKKKKFSSKYLKECYEKGADAIGWSQVNREPRSMKEGDYLIGYGMATATYPANRTASSAKAILFDDGHAEVFCATQDIGTGTYTIMTQIAADALSIPLNLVTVKLGDSTFPKGANSGGSQVTASVGPAIRAACIGVIEKLRDLAITDKASSLYNNRKEEITTDSGQLISTVGKADDFKSIMRRNKLSQVESEIEVNASTRESQEQSQDAEGEVAKNSKSNPAIQEDEKIDRKQFAFDSFGAHFVKVKVDPLLGTVRVVKAVSVMDVGKVMNLKTARNQIMGGMIFGIGMALMEQTVYDPISCRVVTRDLAQYLVPVHADMPDFDIQFINKPDPYISPIGARGIGEIGITGITAAIANAIFHATGKRVRNLPITPEKLI